MKFFFGARMLWPMFGMVLWIFIIAIYSARVRFQSVKSGDVSLEFFQTFQGQASDRVTKLTNNFNNLHQMPMVFLVVCLLIHFQNYADGLYLGLAWGYIALRIGHSLVHITYNKVMHRLVFFIASNMLLMVMWVRTVVLYG